MAATVVYTKPHPDGLTGTLFEGKRFWLSLNVPQRDRFRELIKVGLSCSLARVILIFKTNITAIS